MFDIHPIQDVKDAFQQKVDAAKRRVTQFLAFCGLVIFGLGVYYLVFRPPTAVVNVLDVISVALPVAVVIMMALWVLLIFEGISQAITDRRDRIAAKRKQREKVADRKGHVTSETRMEQPPTRKPEPPALPRLGQSLTPAEPLRILTGWEAIKSLFSADKPEAR